MITRIDPHLLSMNFQMLLCEQISCDDDCRNEYSKIKCKSTLSSTKDTKNHHNSDIDNHKLRDDVCDTISTLRTKASTTIV